MDMKKYLHLFIDEADKHIKSLFKMVEELKKKKQYDKTLINEIFRSFHSIKGMSSALGYTSMADIAHCLEDIFHVYRTREINPDIKYYPGIISAVNILYDKLNSIRENQIDDIDPKDIEKELKNILKVLGSESNKPKPKKIITDRNPIAVLYFKKIPLALAKAFVIIKRIKSDFPDSIFSPDYDEIKKGVFDGYLKIFSKRDELLEYIKDDISKESYIDNIEYFQRDPKEKTEGKPISKEIQLSDQKSQTSAKAKRSIQTSKKIWLDTESLDTLINRLGQLYIHKSILDQSLKEDDESKIKDSFGNLSSLIDRVYGQMIKLRMVPFSTISDEFPFIIKMVSSRQNKTINFSIKGDNIEIDRIILDELKNPLIHILRNAVDHGIETPDERGKKGKDRKGSLHIRIERKSEYINIHIKDDGRGLNADKIKKRAYELKMISRMEYESISDNQALTLITRPGFSSLKQASDISGRGVGMDIVKTTIESLGGRLIIDTEKDAFTQFTLRVPLTMAIQEIVIVENKTHEFAFPSRSVIISSLMQEENLLFDNGSIFLKYDDNIFPAYQIADNFAFIKKPNIKSFPIHCLLVENSPNPNAIIIDRIIETKKAVIKKLPFPFNKFNFLSAITIDDYGKPMMIIDPLRLIRFNLDNA